MTIAEHLVAHTRGGARSLLRPEQAAWLWERLRANLPAALSCVLMPDHVHLVAPPGMRPRLIRVLAAFTTRFRVRFDVLDAQPANSTAIAARMIRYGFLNPVGRLVDDPWAWRWSTLRDLAGAVHPIWTSADALASTLAIPATRLFDTLTTSADHRPRPPQLKPTIAASAAVLRAAVGAALRVPDEALARRLVVQAAHALGMPGVRRLAAELGCCGRTVLRDRAAPHPALPAVLLCLSDARLRDSGVTDRDRNADSAAPTP